MGSSGATLDINYTGLAFLGVLYTGGLDVPSTVTLTGSLNLSSVAVPENSSLSLAMFAMIGIMGRRSIYSIIK